MLLGCSCYWQAEAKHTTRRIKAHLPFVQLLRVHKCRWMTVSNYQVATKSTFLDTVHIYDSGWTVGLTVANTLSGVVWNIRIKAHTVHMKSFLALILSHLITILRSISWQQVQNSSTLTTFWTTFNLGQHLFNLKKNLFILSPDIVVSSCDDPTIFLWDLHHVLGQLQLQEDDLGLCNGRHGSHMVPLLCQLLPNIPAVTGRVTDTLILLCICTCIYCTCTCTVYTCTCVYWYWNFNPVSTLLNVWSQS